jgi:hypothetical protein
MLENPYSSRFKNLNKQSLLFLGFNSHGDVLCPAHGPEIALEESGGLVDVLGVNIFHGGRHLDRLAGKGV